MGYNSMTYYKNQRSFFFFITVPTLLYANTAGDIENTVNQYISSYVEMNQFSGSVLIAQKGHVLISKGFGMADYEFEIPNDSETKFRIGSLTKQFTAVAIMMLEEKNLLSVDDSLTKYIPDYPNSDKIKIKHLLTHTSGIPDHTKFTWL